MELFQVYPLFDITPVKAQGAYITDNQGKQYLDLYGGHAVLSVGHSHPHYVQKLQEQAASLGFYSNSVQNPLQQELADKLEQVSGCRDYQLFLCNSGAEANENALKLASFHTKKKQVIYFSGGFHGRTSAAVAVTDNPSIQAPLNAQHDSIKLPFGNIEALETALQTKQVAAVILEVIQGVGGLDEASSWFYQKAAELCQQYQAVLIADEIQSGYGRTGDFFSFQKHGIRPDIVSMAKGMGNGFPIGGILIDSAIKPKLGMLGTTFGGNHLACAAGIAVLDIMKQEKLMQHTKKLYDFIAQRSQSVPGLKALKGRGLMLGLEFDFEIATLRKNLLHKQQIFTGASANKQLLRILPPLNVGQTEFEHFFEALETELTTL